MRLLKKQKNKYEVTGYVNYASNIVEDLFVYGNGSKFAVSLGNTELELTKEQAKELERLLSHALGVFDTSYYNFD